MLETRADVYRDVIHASIRDCNRVPLVLDADRQKHQRTECLITDLRRCVIHHSSLVDSAKTSLHSDTRHAHETCLPSLLSEVSWRIRDCDAVYHSDIDTQLGAYESIIQQGVHFILASLDHSLEDLRRDDAHADP